MTIYIHPATNDMRDSLPSRFTKRTDTGQWSIPTEETAEQFGWFAVTETDPPAHDPWDIVSREIVHDGSGFVTEWTVTPGVEPLVDPTERPDEDEVAATLRLLTRDAALLKALVSLLTEAGTIRAVDLQAEFSKEKEALPTTKEEIRALQEAALSADTIKENTR